jgi:hypothetical protein
LELKTPPRSTHGEAYQTDEENRISHQDPFGEPTSTNSSALYGSASLINDSRGSEIGGGDRIRVTESPKNKETTSDGPSPFETQVACAIAEDGSIHVHGISSHLHQPSATRPPSMRQRHKMKRKQILKFSKINYSQMPLCNGKGKRPSLVE